jgi:tRNA A37 threonylcarbamoyladenosine dehydratase
MLERLELLVDKEKLNKFINSNILIIGIGGVGGATLNALVRSGLKNVTVIDNDTFTESNLNRQLLSDSTVIGKNKVDVAITKMKEINPELNITGIKEFIIKDIIDSIDFSKFDYVIDCQDTTTTKILLIKKCLEANTKIICSMGTGNRFDPTKLMITNIWKTNNDPLAKRVRNIMRKENIKAKIPVLSSSELPIKTGCETIGSNAFVPNSAGFLIASYVFNDIIN